MATRKRHGFTLIEIMIVVGIIGVIAAIAIPNFRRSVKNSQKQSCIANLRLLESAVLEAKFFIPAGEITMEKLVGNDRFIKVVPVCPTENLVYTDLNPPACPSLPEEHRLPFEDL